MSFIRFTGLLIVLIATIWLVAIFPWLLLVAAIGWGITLFNLMPFSSHKDKPEKIELIDLDEETD